jgi:hypothetical protein
MMSTCEEALEFVFIQSSYLFGHSMISCHAIEVLVGYGTSLEAFLTVQMGWSDSENLLNVLSQCIIIHGN